MKRQDLMDLENIVMEEVVRRRKLGGYNPDAGGILLLAEILMKLLRHTIDEYPEEAIIPDNVKFTLAPKKKSK